MYNLMQKLLSHSIITLLILFSNSLPLGFIEQTSLGKLSFLIAAEVKSSWDRPVVPGFAAKEDDPEHGQGHDADDGAGDPRHPRALPETAAGVISLENR